MISIKVAISMGEGGGEEIHNQNFKCNTTLLPSVNTIPPEMFSHAKYTHHANH